MLEIEPRDSHIECKGSTVQWHLWSYSQVFKKVFARGSPQLTCHFNLYPSSFHLPVWNADFMPGEAAAIPWWGELNLHAEDSRRGRMREAIWSSGMVWAAVMRLRKPPFVCSKHLPNLLKSHFFLFFFLCNWGNSNINAAHDFILRTIQQAVDCIWVSQMRLLGWEGSNKPGQDC